MKTIFTIFAFLLATLTIKAQDIITLKNGTEIKGAITEISPEQVKFKKTADGPIYTLAKADVFMIVYENGRKEVFSAETTTAPTTQNGTDANNNSNCKEKGDQPIVPKKHYGGPRIGFTIVGDGMIAEQMRSNATMQFEPQFPKDSVAYDTIKIDSILKARLVDFPRVNPAIKRGIPVKTQFILPVRAAIHHHTFDTRGVAHR